MTALCAAIRDLTIAQSPAGAADLDQLICDGKTQVTLYSAALGVAVSQACYATSELDLEGVLVQADALHIHKPFFISSRTQRADRSVPAGALGAGIGSATPSSTRMPTATGALNLLRLAGFKSIRDGMQAVMHDITALLAMTMRRPGPKTR